MLDISISKADIDNIKERVLLDTMPEIASTVTSDFSSLRKAARFYLDNLEKIRIDLADALRVKNLVKARDMKTQVNNVIKMAYQARQLASVYFMDALDKYLGILPRKAIFVVTDNKGKTYDIVEMTMEELVKLISCENRLVANISKKNRLNYNSIQISEEHSQQVTAAYQGTNNRLQRYYELKKSSQNQGGILLFKQSSDWTFVRITNEGVIKEAYAAAYLAEHGGNDDYLYGVARGNGPYYSEELIGSFYNYYLAKVTNAETIIEEDIVLTDRGIQYGVKSRRATFDTTSQTENVAKKILNVTFELSPKELQKMISDEYHRNAKLAPTIENALKTLADEELDFVNQITSSKY